jgi:hypothetical protein
MINKKDGTLSRMATTALVPLFAICGGNSQQAQPRESRLRTHEAKEA